MQAATDVKFKVGDKAVYPAQGVAEVIRIEEKDIAGSRQQFYVLRILDTDRKIMVPVANASAVGLRQVISEQEIREIFDILRERTIAFDNQTWNRRYRGFMDKIKTGSIYDVAEVLRDLYRLKTDKQLSFGERRMLDTARDAHRQGDRDRAQADRRAGQDRDRSDLRRELSHPSADSRLLDRSQRSRDRILEDSEVPALAGFTQAGDGRLDATNQVRRRRDRLRERRRPLARPLPYAGGDDSFDGVDEFERPAKPRR